MKYIKTFENFNNDNLINNIKSDLISELYLEDEYDSLENGWKKYVDNQEMGDCQNIVSSIMIFAKNNNLKNIQKHFGEIETDDGDLYTHHWITIDDDIYEFSKGTLKNDIDFSDLYSVECENENIYKNEVKFNETLIYRGERENHNPPFGGSGYYKGTYFFTGNNSLEYAKKFGTKLITKNIDNLKIFTIDTPEKLKQLVYKAGYDTRDATGYPESNYLIDLGYDGLQIGNEIVLFPTTIHFS